MGVHGIGVFGVDLHSLCVHCVGLRDRYCIKALKRSINVPLTLKRFKDGFWKTDQQHFEPLRLINNF
jgi:hypothetical protein